MTDTETPVRGAPQPYGDGLEKYDVFLPRDRELWLRLRERDLTASAIGAICGLDKYSSPLKVAAEKMGMLPRVESNAVQRRGLYTEMPILAMARDQRPTWEIRPAHCYIRDPVRRMGATPDFVAVDPEREGFGCIQAKSIAQRIFRKEWRCEAIDDDDDSGDIIPPVNHQLQTIMEAKMLGASWAMLAALVIGEFVFDLHLVEVPIHEEAWRRIVGEVEHFWRQVDQGIMPSAMAPQDVETLGLVYRHETLPQLDLTADNEAVAQCRRREEIGKLIAELAFEKDQIEVELKDKIRLHESAILADGRILKWKTEQRAGYVVKPSERRVLRIGKAKS